MPRNLLATIHGFPSDLALATPQGRRIAAELRATGQACTYVFNNAGALYHLAAQGAFRP
jgi:hypothetical protein